jgi:outer membrane lipoprotein SlyB
MDSGETIAVVQGADLAFSPGQRVQVVSGGDATRVTPI